MDGIDPRTAFDFGGRVVVVTGGGRGVGLAITLAFLSSGAEVVVCGRHRPVPSDLPRVQGPGGEERAATFVEADVREADQARGVVEAAVAGFGRLDVLVNNAGGSPHAMAAEATPRFVASVVALNLLAPFYCAQAANEVMQPRRRGIDREHGQRVRVATLAGHRRVRGGQGRAGEPDRDRWPSSGRPRSGSTA